MATISVPNLGKIAVSSSNFFITRFAVVKNKLGSFGETRRTVLAATESEASQEVKLTAFVGQSQ
jgi:hypothetical protein